MEVKGKLTNLDKNLLDGKVTFTFETDSLTAAEELEKLADMDLRIKAVRYRKKRSLSANNLFWHCISKIAAATRSDAWQTYLSLLRDYGKFTHLVCRPDMVEAVQRQWRECEVWRTVDVDGEPMIEVIAYFGSSTYDSAEMARLIDGTLEEMKELKLDLPMTQDVKAALDAWEAQHDKVDYPE